LNFGKRLTLIAIVLVNTTFAMAQIVVVNQDLTPIINVHILKGGKSVAISDDKGVLNVDTSSLGLDTLTLAHQGYYKKNISINNLRNGCTIILSKKTNTFNPIVITPRVSRLSSDFANKVDLIGRKKIALYQPQTTADLLNIGNTVYVQKSQLGGGSPMIRGFATSRVLLVIDGVRMNTAIFRDGNVQNVISLDPFSIESTEVIFGPSSQLYGSDAIGGVLGFQTVTPQYSKTDTPMYTGAINLRYSSASNERTWHAQFNAGKKKLASFTSVTYSSFGDLKMGKNGPDEYTKPDFILRIADKDTILQNANTNEQVFSGYNQINFLEKISYKLNKHLTLNYGFHFSTTSDIPRYDRLLERGDNDTLINGDWYYGPQTWRMNHLSLKESAETFLADSFFITLAHQKFEESRNSRKYTSNVLTERSEKVSAWSLNADFEKESKWNALINYGLEYVHNTVNSGGILLDITDGSTTTTSSRYPDGSTWASSGVYFNVFKKWKTWYKTDGGIRYNFVQTHGVLDTTYQAYPVPTFDIANQAVTGSLSHLFKLKKGTVGIVTSTAFRSPNIDDISKVFDSNTGYVTIPNVDIKPEYAYNGEINASYHFFDRLNLSTSLFYTYLDGAIGLENTTLNGRDSILFGSTMSQVQTLKNQDYATVYGLQVTLKYLLNDNITLNSSYTILESASSDDEPIRHITPNFGGSSLEYNKGKWNVSVSSSYNQEFRNTQFTSAEKNRSFIYAKDENNLPYSPSWFTLNARANFKLKENIGLNVALENILDNRYRPYASRITAPGRNLQVALRASF